MLDGINGIRQFVSALTSTKRNQKILLALGLAGLLILPQVVPGNFAIMMLDQAGLYVMMAWGLNLIRGYAGIFQLGYGAFMLIGSYMWAILASPLHNLHLPFLAVWPLAALAAAAVGYLLTIPGLGLRGNYLAIVTLAFGEIIRLVTNNLSPLTNGPEGIPSIDPPRILGWTLSSTREYYYFILALVLIELVLMQRLVNSRIGRAWMAIREDEEAAKAMGLDVNRLKLLVSAIGAIPAGLAGVLFAGLTSFISPVSFTMAESTAMFSMVVVGGSGSIPGTALGAVVLSLVTEFLRDQFKAYRLFVYGLLLMIFSVFRPQGLIPSSYGKVRPEGEAEDTVAGADSVVGLGGKLPMSSVSADSPADEPADVGTGEVILDVQGVSRHFGALRAVENVSFQVKAGQIFSIIGPNGAGKSTLFNVLAGVYDPTVGEAHFMGKPILGLRQHEVTRLGMARTFQKLRLFRDLTVLDNVLVGMHCRTESGVWDACLQSSKHKSEDRITVERAHALLRFVGIEKYWWNRARNLPYGHQRRLELARALATEPKLLLLDEPFCGMTPSEKEEMMALIGTIRDQGITVVLVEHDMRVVMGMSDWVIVLDHGEQICEGACEFVQADQRVVEAYLGRGLDDEPAGS